MNLSGLFSALFDNERLVILAEELEKPRGQSNRTVERLSLLLILLLAFGLRMAYLDGSSLWSDEGNSWALIQRSYTQIATEAAADIHPPGYYWLLKVWTSVMGITAAGMRTFSVWLSVLLVALIFRTAVLILPTTSSHRYGRPFGLLAATIAAVNPFQIYYAHEARMYMLLTTAGALLFLGLILYLKSELASAEANSSQGLLLGRVGFAGPLLLLFSGILGLWTHYSFPILLAGAAIAYGCHWLLSSLRWQGRLGRDYSSPFSIGQLVRFGLIYALIGLLFLPWAGIAVRQVLSWPQGGGDVSVAAGAAIALQTLAFGPLRNVKEPNIWLLISAGVLPLLGLVGLWRVSRMPTLPTESRLTIVSGAIALFYWLAAPIVMMFSLALFNDAFLKFLLTASPAWCLLIAAVPWIAVSSETSRTKGGWLRFSLLALSALVVLFTGAVAYLAIPGYFQDETARDNYKGIAEYMVYSAAARRENHGVQTAAEQTGQLTELSATDKALVILNAPGQQDVWGYYDPGLPVLPLPIGRPIDRGATLAKLEAIADVHQIYAIFWATDQSDPEGIVANWLAHRGYEGLDTWQGNIRLVTYTLIDGLVSGLPCFPFESPPEFTEASSTEASSTEVAAAQRNSAQLRLLQWCHPSAFRVVGGDVALIALHWQALQPIEQRLKITIQLLDSRNQVIAQRDSEPAGGSRPTTDWVPFSSGGDIGNITPTFPSDMVVIDNHGLLIPHGTPPGRYRLITALYEPTTGQRYVTNDGDFIELGQVEVVQPKLPPPLALLPIDHKLAQPFSSVVLLGYDLYAKGFAHEPERVIEPGEQVHVTLYWQATQETVAVQVEDIQMRLNLGAQELNSSLSGGNFPTSLWLPKQIIRGEFDILFDGSDRTVFLEVEGDVTELGQIPLD